MCIGKPIRMVVLLYHYEGAYLALLARREGVSLRRMASLAGVNANTMSGWVNGRAQPSVGHLANLAEAFSMDLGELVKMLWRNGEKPRSRMAQRLQARADREPPKLIPLADYEYQEH